MHVSTAYAHCHLKGGEAIQERIYEEEREALMDRSSQDPLCGRPNTYTCTKAMAELLLAEEEFSGLPAAVVRPSIVVAARREPHPGWVDNYNGATGTARKRDVFFEFFFKICTTRTFPNDD